MLGEILLALVGLVTLVGGGELLVRGSIRLAEAFGLSPLLIGVTVVSLGTSAPELAVSLEAAIAGKAAVAVGNVVGSNLLNTLVVLGASALIVALLVSPRLVRWDVPVMILSTFLVWWLGWDGFIGRGDGLILLALLTLYLCVAVVFSRRDAAASEPSHEEGDSSQAGNSRPALPRSLLETVIGLILLALGAAWFVNGATEIARTLGVSELVISLTIVAIGTSLPELITAVVAAFRGENDIAVGNVVGSNIMNLLLILGVSSVSVSGGLAVPAEVLEFDMPFCLVTAAICLPIFWTGYRIERSEGALFLVAYVVFLVGLVLEALGSPWAQPAHQALYFVVAPLAVLVLSLAFWRQLRPSPVVN